jgi:DUF1680 family protein
VLGAARRYDRTGDARFRDAAIYFWDRTAIARSYVNGGSSGPRPDGAEKSKGAEHWPEPNRLANTLTPKINESCVTHNMLRLTDALFTSAADPRYAEFYERAYFNSVLCMQHPHRLGGYIYDHPLGDNSRKTFGHANDAFWCCYGTTVEAYARLAQGIYYHDDEQLWVNLAVASSLRWAEKGVRIEQRTRFPDEDVVRLVFECDAPVELTINARIPVWANGVDATINGEAIDMRGARTGAYHVITRTWRTGDVLALRFPMTFRAEPMPDDPNLIAFCYGPLVLAAPTDRPLVLRSASLPRCFRIQLADGAEVELTPLNEVVDEPFGVYFRVESP